MRLINVHTYALEEFPGVDSVPPYAILSHTWAKTGEVTYQDIQNPDTAQAKDGFIKIYCTCEQAKSRGLQYAWVDTCCIDNKSSSELSEAINSMYRWYMNAVECYVLLTDVPGNCPLLEEGAVTFPAGLRWVDVFEESRWFTRGWTLQELIAPRVVFFFGAAWNYIGELANLIDRVSDVTGIPVGVLDHSRPVSDLTVARRLAWAAKRSTTRKEDEAYSLFGIMGVNMPLLYGEGSKAFLRLQEEIIEHSTDQSIFAWDMPADAIVSRELLLAPSPRCFLNGEKLRRIQGTGSESAFRLSNKGLEITLPVVHRRLQGDPDSPLFTLGLLDCRYQGSPDALALVMSQHPYNTQRGTLALDMYVSGYDKPIGDTSRYARLVRVGARDRDEAVPRQLTITKDLQNQTYMQALSANRASWFPLRFTGGELDHVPSLRAVDPDQCWHNDSLTMRLRMPDSPSGGVAMDLRDGRSVLLSFGMYSGSPLTRHPSRAIYGMAFVDRQCPLQPHIESMTHERGPAARAGLRLNEREHILAQLWHGALTVSIESVAAGNSAPTSPVQPSTSPTSPVFATRRPSIALPPRRDSVLQDDRSDRSQEDYASLLHYTPQCDHCRWKKEEYEPELARKLESRRRRDSEESAKRQRQETQKKYLGHAKNAARGFSIGKVVLDLAEWGEDLLV